MLCNGSREVYGEHLGGPLGGEAGVVGGAKGVVGMGSVPNSIDTGEKVRRNGRGGG
jgi:hypothetical protein